MSDLIREIQEDIEREKWLSLWQRFGRIIIAVALAIVVFVAANQALKAYHHSQGEKYTSQLLNAVKNPTAEGFAKVAKQTKGAHSGIARLIQAQLLLAEGKHSESERTLKSLSESGDEMPNQLARALVADAKSADKNRNSAFRATALEHSGWAAIAANEYEAATKAFKALHQMEKAPESMKERAKSALAFIQTQGTPDSKE